MDLQLPQDYLDWINHHTKLIDTQEALLPKEDLGSIWENFSASEAALLEELRTGEKSDSEREPEFGLTLYILNHMILPENRDIFRKLGMPASAISTDMVEADFAQADGTGAVAMPREVTADGSLLLPIPFALLDPGWAGSAIRNLFRLLKIIPTHQFGMTPAKLNLFPEKESLSIGVIGDWGTGLWADGHYNPPAKLISDALKNMPDPPDIVIHLGDVYYSGLAREEQRNLLKLFPSAKGNCNFTLNSNHETYDGAVGYFDTALKSSIFSRQKNTSYFAIYFKDWVIIALDSAYFDKSFMIKKGALTDNNTIQKDFEASLNIQAHQKVILLTHHPALDYSGVQVNQPLVGQVHDVLGGIYPDYWYYGHIHLGVVYNGQSAMGGAGFYTRSGTYPRIRCIGHSAIPFGKADLKDNPGISYFAHTPMPNPDDKQMKRVLNGFALTRLSEGQIVEKVYEVSPLGIPELVWEG